MILAMNTLNSSNPIERGEKTCKRGVLVLLPNDAYRKLRIISATQNLSMGGWIKTKIMPEIQTGSNGGGKRERTPTT
jgi:hypothetical protein